MLGNCLENVRKSAPLVHNITNYVTVNAAANPDNMAGAVAAAVCVMGLAGEIGVPFVINDNVDIAIKMNADGVHVGQSDMEAGDVSHETLKAICDAVNIPVVAIGGIGKHNVLELSGSGILRR